MDRTLPIIPEAIYSEADGLYHCGPGEGASHADAVADAMMLGAFLSPVTDGTSALRYDLMLDVAGPDVPLEGPSVEEEGGEGGEPPPDDYVAALAAHVAREYTAFLAAAPDSPAPSPLQPAPAGGEAANAAGPCDVSGCAAPGSTVWLGRWPAYPARLCGAHRKAVA